MIRIRMSTMIKLVNKMYKGVEKIKIVLKIITVLPVFIEGLKYLFCRYKYLDSRNERYLRKPLDFKFYEREANEGEYRGDFPSGPKA